MSKLSTEQQKLIETLMPDVKSIARLILKRRDEDFEQTALVILTELVAIGWTEPAYIKRRLRDRLKDHIRVNLCNGGFKFTRYEDSADGGSDVLSDVISREFLRTLTGEEYRAVELRVSGHKLREIAEDLDVSETDVKSIMRRVRKKLSEFSGE